MVVLILLISGMQITLDRHFCGGELAGTKLSLTGKMASCGMIKEEPLRSDRPSIDKKCCEDQVTLFSISSRYFPEYFKLKHPITQKYIPFSLTGNTIKINSTPYGPVSWVLPPGQKVKPVVLSEICVFRI